MFFVFGFGRRTIKELGPAGKIQCNHCSNVREWQYKKATTWFTLFFIPVIPYKTVYFKQCPICQTAYEVDKYEATGEVDGCPSHNHSNNLTDVQKNYRAEMEALKRDEESQKK